MSVDGYTRGLESRVDVTKDFDELYKEILRGIGLEVVLRVRILVYDRPGFVSHSSAAGGPWVKACCTLFGLRTTLAQSL